MVNSRTRAEQEAVGDNVVVTLEQWAPLVLASPSSIDTWWRMKPGFPLPVARGLGRSKSGYLYRLADLTSWYRQWMAERLRVHLADAGHGWSGPITPPTSDPAEYVTLATLDGRLGLPASTLTRFQALIEEAVLPEVRTGRKYYFPIGAAVARINALITAHGPGPDGSAEPGR